MSQLAGIHHKKTQTLKTNSLLSARSYIRALHLIYHTGRMILQAGARRTARAEIEPEH